MIWFLIMGVYLSLLTFKVFLPLYAFFLLKKYVKNKMISPAKFKLVRKQRGVKYWDELEIGKVYEVFNTMIVPTYHGQDMVLSLDSGDHVWAAIFIRSFRYLGKYQCHAYKP